MKTHFKPAALGALLALLFAGTVTTANAAPAFPLGSSPKAPARQGDVQLQTTHNGNVGIKLRVKHLAPAGRTSPGSEVYVLRARGPAAGSAAQNLGALKADKNPNGRIIAITPMPAFDRFISCEQSQVAVGPAHLELVSFHHPSK